MDKNIPPRFPSEHLQTRVLAQRCMRTAQVGSPGQIHAICTEAVACCAAWEPYFEREESFLFPLGKRLGGDLARLCRQLEDEHRELRRFCRYLQEGDSSALYGFGALLHAHCRAETAVLLPTIEAHLDAGALIRLHQALSAPTA